MNQKLLQQALDALEETPSKFGTCSSAIAALKGALAQPDNAPVAWMKRTYAGGEWDQYDFSANQYEGFQTPLYTTPQIAQPVQPTASTLKSACEVGEKGAPHTESERLLFEEYMRGHCWMCDSWNANKAEYYDMHQRVLYAVFRARAAIAQPVQPAAHPVALEPMAPTQIISMLDSMGMYYGDLETAIVRAVEKHHGIVIGKP